MTGPSVDAIPRVAFELAGAFAARGFGLWLVGGWVRDVLLGKVVDDLDFATDARPEQSLAILEAWGRSRPWTTGFEFGTVGVQADGFRLEVTTFRQEVYRAESRNPEVTFAERLETDLSRRDFTINALAIALPEVELVDPFGGLSDLAARRIRAPISPEVSFSDDPLRMLRAVRFASTLDFTLDASVETAIRAMHDRLAIVSRERVRDELSKLMLGQAPSLGLDLATRTGLAHEFLPELPALSLEQDPIHRHKDVFHHTLAVLDNVCASDRDE
ncbi:MAG: CCA tRNA nucleotidyltransferase, partial [Actinomycetota bacterium]